MTEKPLTAPDSRGHALTRNERAEALQRLAEAWWDPPAELVDTLPKGGVELRYLSHIWVRKAFQDADPFWWWEPMGYDDQGQPVVQVDAKGQPVGLWIWLHLLGTKMPGYGSVEPGKRDAIKELIGDALRNAGMRVCGGALWVKGGATKPKPKAKPQAKADAVLDYLRDQVPPPDDAPHYEKAAGKDAFDRLVEEFGENATCDALKSFGLKQYSEITPEKAFALKASLLSAAREAKENDDRAAQLAKEKGNAAGEGK